MEHPLQTFLQLQLASDSSAVLHLPHLLKYLTSESFLPSPHIQKWTARVNSLVHSKDSGSRWAGLCLAHKTCTLSKSIMIECAQSWLSVALPILSKTEPVPTLKAAVRLLKYIVSTAVGVPEFQRQVVAPNIPKISAALIGLAGNHSNIELKVVSLYSLTRFVTLFPTQHRALHTDLLALSSKLLNFSAYEKVDERVLAAVSQLLSALPFIGGKVGAANLWQKSVTETLASAWSAFLGLRSTFPTGTRSPVTPPSVGDPLVSIPVNLDRLRCYITILCDLLKSATHRAVQVPIGPLVGFSTTLLGCTASEQIDGFFEPIARTMEVSIIPTIWKLSCDLIVCLTKCTCRHLTPHVPKLVLYITVHLEKTLPSSQRISFLRALEIILDLPYPLHDPLLLARLSKAILLSLSTVLVIPSETSQSESISASNNTKGKKRARRYEGDEVFKISREVICKTSDDGNVILAAVRITQLLLRNPFLSPPMVSISSRALLSILLSLPQISPTSLSPDLSIHARLLSVVQEACAMVGCGTTAVMSRSLGLIIGASIANSTEDRLLSGSGFDILLHPRVPPVLRSLPNVESLSLFRKEESQEEIDARKALYLEVTNPSIQTVNPSAAVTMDENMDVEEAPVATATPAFDHPPLSFGVPVAANPERANNLPSVIKTSTDNMSHSKPESALVPNPTSLTMAVLEPLPVIASFACDDEDNEDIPAINMDSDSD